jgi:hypothetical protein
MITIIHAMPPTIEKIKMEYQFTSLLSLFIDELLRVRNRPFTYENAVTKIHPKDYSRLARVFPLGSIYFRLTSEERVTKSIRFQLPQESF